MRSSREACTDCVHSHVPAAANTGGPENGAADYIVALAGNPNTGKSTVFNALTGLRQHTGNWPGKTVARAEGEFTLNGHRFKLIDLPGTYSLLSNSEDEEIARNFLLFGEPDATIAVVDSTRLERNLALVLQILEITDRVVVCLNLMDEARRHGIDIDVERLSHELGVPVVPCVARSGEGLADLCQTTYDLIRGRIDPHPRKLRHLPDDLASAVERLTASVLALFPGLPNARWVALRLLDGDEHLVAALKTGEIGDRAT